MASDPVARGLANAVANSLVTANYTTVAAAAGDHVNPNVSIIYVVSYGPVLGQGSSYYKRVNSQPSHPWKFQSADGAWWEGYSVDGLVNPYQFGGDAATPALNQTAFANMIAYGEAHTDPNSYPPAVTVIYEIPAGWWALNSTLTITKPSRIEGKGFTGTHVYNCVLKFPAGQIGLIIGPNANGTMLRGFSIFGANSLADASGSDGVLCRTQIGAEEIMIYGFSGHGLHIQGVTGSGYIADNGHFLNCNFENNQFCGVYIEGADGNVNTFRSCSAVNNGKWGYSDESFLGCMFEDCHERGNGIYGTAPIPSGFSGSKVTYGGKTWLLVPGRGQTSYPLGASTTPGTNSAVWAQWLTYADATYPAWSNLASYCEGGSFKSQSGNNGRGSYLGCYQEGDQLGQTPWIENYAKVIGGMLGSAIPHYPYLRTPQAMGDDWITRATFPDGLSSSTMTLGWANAQGGLIGLWHQGIGWGWFLSDFKPGGSVTVGFQMVWGVNAKPPAFALLSDNYTVANGGARELIGTLPTINFLSGPFINNSCLWFDTAAPTTLNRKRGDVIVNSTPSANGVALWRCTLDGTPGTWEAVYGSSVPIYGPTAYASLPTPAAAGAGARAYVTDATVAIAFNTIVNAGGGANAGPIWSDGANWRYG